MDADGDVPAALAAITEGFSGAEIEQVVIAALYEAFFADRGLRKEDLVKCVQDTVALSVTQKEQIVQLREWAAKRAVLATAREDREQEPGGVPEKDFYAAQGGRIVDFEL